MWQITSKRGLGLLSVLQCSLLAIERHIRPPPTDTSSSQQ